MTLPLRAKLILIMSVVVAGGTVGTALVTQGYVSRVYQRNLEEDFRAEVRYFTERQFQRLDDIRKQCRKLAANETLASAIEKSDASKIRAQVMDELREFYEAPIPPGFLGPVRPNAEGGKDLPRSGGAQGRTGAFAKLDGQAFRPSDRPTVGVVDAEGEVITMLDPDGKLVSLDEARSVLARRRDGPNDKQRELFRASMKRLAEGADEKQEIGYTMARGFDGKPHLRELIVTPVVGKKHAEPVGAVIVAVLTSDLGERQLQTFSRQTDGSGPDRKDGLGEGISSGFWLDGKLHTETIPEAVQEPVAAAVAKHLEAHPPEGGKFIDLTLDLLVHGETVPHKLLYRVLNPGSPYPLACQVAIYSLKKELAEEAELQQKIINIGLAALAVALLLILYLSKGLIKPVHELVAATEQVRKGNYDVVVPVRSRDEIGQLATSFNEMAEGLKLNRKYQRLLSQIADRLVAEQLINVEGALGGEMREVSVLFCDIRGFTRLTATMQPPEVIALLNEHMTAMTALVHQHGGVVDKFVGDMIMVLFGAPSAFGDDAMRAAQCALRMILRRDELNAQGRWDFQVGIGIATGMVVAGCMGSEQRLDYTVLGERVNLAARLCSEAAPGEVLIDNTTMTQLGTTATADRLDNLALKGFPETVTAYRLQGLEVHSQDNACNPSDAG
jgi:class 3 adenylate cyclase